MKRTILVISLSLLSLSLMAAPIGEKRAREIATKFFTSATRSDAAPSLDLAWVGNDMEQNLINSATRSTQAGASDDALLYIYNRTDAEGFVVVAGDSNAEREIIAFSFDNSFDTENMAEGARAMLQAWCEDIANTRNSKSATTRATIIINGGEVVREYATAKWGQSTPFNNECPLINGQRAETGCVATAAAIICHYLKWPEKGVGETGKYSYTRAGVKVTVPNNVLGRTYDYDNMLMTYKNVSYTNEQAAAVSALMWDIGAATHLGYGVESTGGNVTNLAKALIKYFSFSKELQFLPGWSYTESEWYSMLKENLDKYGPTYYCGRNSNDGGHIFLLDGYTESNYFRINYGWNGSSNGYYYLPTIGYRFKQQAIFKMIPDKDGTSKYRYCLMLESSTINNVEYQGINSYATKYEIGTPFKVAVKVFNRSLTDFEGHFCIAHCDNSGKIKDVLHTYDLTTESLVTSAAYTQSVVLKSSIEEGDCLICFYKGINESDWSRMRHYTENAIDYVPICVAANDVAKNTTIEYDKSTRVLTFSSPYATQCSVTDSTGNVVVSSETMAYHTGTLKLNTLMAGEYNLSFASSSKPHTIKFRLHKSNSDGSFGLNDLGTDVDTLL